MKTAIILFVQIYANHFLHHNKIDYFTLKMNLELYKNNTIKPKTNHYSWKITKSFKIKESEYSGFMQFYMKSLLSFHESDNFYFIYTNSEKAKAIKFPINSVRLLYM